MRNLIILLTLVLLTGCMSFTDRPLRPVRNSIAQQMPEIRLKKEIGIAIGGGLFNFLDVVTFNEADLSEIDHLDVAVYEIHPRGGNVNFTGLGSNRTSSDWIVCKARLYNSFSTH